MRRPSPPALVAFDLDDTLYLETDFIRSGFAAVEEALGIEGLAATAWALHAGGLRGSVLGEALRRHGREGIDDDATRAVAIYRAHRPRIDLAADAAAALASLAADPSIELALISDGFAETQRNKIEALGIKRWIREMVLTDELAPDRACWKPHSAAFRRLQAARACPAVRVYVADNPRKDFDAPVQLGWHTVRLRRPGGLWEHEPDGAARPAITVLDLSSLSDHLRTVAQS
jgi:putative hydrolase of the HAD superfamily